MLQLVPWLRGRPITRGRGLLDEFLSETGAVYPDAQARSGGAAVPSAPVARKRGATPSSGGADSSTLPDAVVNAFRESLDDDGLRFLKRGPRSFAEQLASIQRVDPNAHLFASLAPASAYDRYRTGGAFDADRYFVGPDNELYQRDARSPEPLAYRLRRGIEDAVGGYNRPDVGQLVAASFSVPAAPAGSQVDPHLQPVRGGAPVGAPETEYDRLKQLAPEDLEKLGYPLFGEMWKQYRGATGGDAWVSSSRLREYPWIWETQERLHGHFLNWMRGTHAKKAVVGGKAPAFVDSGLEQIKGDLAKMKDGETIVRSSQWIGKFGVNAGMPLSEDPSKVVPLALEQRGWKGRTPEGDLTGALGKSNIAADGTFSFERDGDRIRFHGVVANNIDDPFDFDPNQTYPMVDKKSSFPASGTAFNRLEREGLAKQFHVRAGWREKASGTLLVKPDGSLELESVRWEPLTQPRGPR